MCTYFPNVVSAAVVAPTGFSPLKSEITAVCSNQKTRSEKTLSFRPSLHSTQNGLQVPELHSVIWSQHGL